MKKAPQKAKHNKLIRNNLNYVLKNSKRFISYNEVGLDIKRCKCKNFHLI